MMQRKQNPMILKLCYQSALGVGEITGLLGNLR